LIAGIAPKKRTKYLGFQKGDRMKTYTKEYKKEAISCYFENGRNCRKTAEELGVPEPTLRGWVKKYMKNNEDRKDILNPKRRDLEAELKEKDKLIKQLEEENLILKKSIGIFVKNPFRK